jgi:hypothetical protein
LALSDDIRICPGSVAMEKIVELRKEFRLKNQIKLNKQIRKFYE